jgi:hypothetical protein
LCSTSAVASFRSQATFTVAIDKRLPDGMGS